MEKRILEYRRYIDAVLSTSEINDIRCLREEHLTQIAFFQHERLVHLIVTVTFALLEMMSVLMCVLVFQPGVILLAVVILVLLIPYIRHYYILENEVQKMYVQYDKMTERIRK